MSNPGKQPGKKASLKTKFQVKPVRASVVAAIVLEELSRSYPDVCNFSEAVSLCHEGEMYLALLSVKGSIPQGLKSSAESSARQVWVYAQAEASLKKLSDPSYDRWPDTKATWFSAEERNRKLNKKFNALASRQRLGQKPLPFQVELKRFNEAIHYILGSEVPVEDILQEAHYGPGSTTGVRGQDVNYVRKVEANECTPLSVDLAARSLVYDKAVWEHLGMDPVYSHLPEAREGFVRVARELLNANVVSHDRLMFILKNMTTHRSIGAQPTCSGSLQLGVHSVGTRLLLQAGIDLSDQGWNQRLAYMGSRDWRDANPWCTLDKSNASNSTARDLVQTFFPPAWAKFLQRIRTPGYTAPPEIGGGDHTYEMYAGMGNGSTFLVETLVFWAATYATWPQDGTVGEYVEKRPYAIYGDDVIIRRDHAMAYQPFARFLGYRFNMEKTFVAGPFRESCGADYFDGVSVRAATLNPSSGDGIFIDLPSLVSFHNQLADHKVFALPRAMARIRQLARTHLYPILPTDPQGNLGFRPVGDLSYYDIVKDAGGTPLLSTVWQRPRTYHIVTTPKWGDLGKLDPWTQIAVSLLRAKQSGPRGTWELPVRGLVNYKIEAERDMVRKDLQIMLLNQLKRLGARKAQPWFKSSRGQG